MVWFENSELKTARQIQTHQSLGIFCGFWHEHILCLFFVKAPIVAKKQQTKPEMNRPLFVAFSSQEEWWTKSPALSQFSNQETEPAVHQSEVSAPSLHSTAHKELSSRLLHLTCQFTVNRHLFIDGLSSSVWLFKYHSLKHWAWEPPLTCPGSAGGAELFRWNAPRSGECSEGWAPAMPRPLWCWGLSHPSSRGAVS